MNTEVIQMTTNDLTTDYVWEKNGFIIRPAHKEDAQRYFRENYCPLDKEVARLTGCKEVFTENEVISFFLKSIDSDDRYLFLVIAPDGRIIGETVINEIDWDLRCANFRIAIFHTAECGNGIGSWAIEVTRDFAFRHLKLHRLELDVYSFNPRAQKAYQNAGFKLEGILRDAIMDNGQYGDDILMAILEDEWKAITMS